MISLLGIGVFVLGAAGLCWAVWRYDQFEREPPHLVVLAVALGFLLGVTFVNGQVALILAFERLFPFHEGVHGIEYAAALVATLLEDVPKVLLTALFAWRIRSHFNDPFDGLIYGSLIGAGFAIGETKVRWDEVDSPPMAALQGLLIVIGHMLFGGIACFGLGLRNAAHPGYRRLWAPGVLIGLGFVLPVHFLYDMAVAFSEHATLHFGRRDWLAICGGAGLLALAMVVFFFLIALGSVLSKEKFSPDCPRPPLGELHRRAMQEAWRRAQRMLWPQGPG